MLVQRLNNAALTIHSLLQSSRRAVLADEAHHEIQRPRLISRHGLILSRVASCDPAMHHLLERDGDSRVRHASRCDHDISDSEESDDGEAGERVVSSIQLVLIDCTGCARARDP